MLPHGGVECFRGKIGQFLRNLGYFDFLSAPFALSALASVLIVDLEVRAAMRTMELDHVSPAFDSLAHNCADTVSPGPAFFKPPEILLQNAKRKYLAVVPVFDLPCDQTSAINGSSESDSLPLPLLSQETESPSVFSRNQRSLPKVQKRLEVSVA
ncbi:MAG: hypothetical protein ABFD92_11530 [Planctomycetaceae bacterium]|nr:hypothetical protein [Planctomycetaceae bacterium]